jgi:hypothetical protein
MVSFYKTNLARFSLQTFMQTTQMNADMYNALLLFKNNSIARESLLTEAVEQGGGIPVETCNCKWTSIKDCNNFLTEAVVVTNTAVAIFVRTAAFVK